jgi:hypothetical protein
VGLSHSLDYLCRCLGWWHAGWPSDVCEDDVSNGDTDRRKFLTEAYEDGRLSLVPSSEGNALVKVRSGDAGVVDLVFDITDASSVVNDQIWLQLKTGFGYLHPFVADGVLGPKSVVEDLTDGFFDEGRGVEEKGPSEVRSFGGMEAFIPEDLQGEGVGVPGSPFDIVAIDGHGQLRIGG